MSLALAECPVCKTPISQTRFALLQEQIRIEESEKLEKLRVGLQVQSDAKVAQAVKVEAEKIATDAAKQIALASASSEKLKRDLDEAKLRAKALEDSHEIERKQSESENHARLSVAVAEAAKKAGAEAQNKMALLEDRQKQLQSALDVAQQRESEASKQREVQIKVATDAAVAAVRQEAKLELDAIRKRQGDTEKQRDAARIQADQAIETLKASHEIELARREAEARAAANQELRKETSRLEEARLRLADRLSAAELQVKEQQSSHADELQRQRAILDEAKLEEVARIRAQVAEDKEGLRKKVAELERKIEQKTANELGQIPEAEIERALREAFPDDGIHRVAKGQPGADIIQTVKHKGQSCGKIVIDSKNHLQWRDSFAEKLSQDCLNAEAKHAILSTVAFPKGVKDLVFKDGVVLAKPAQVVGLVDLLRRTMIQSHIQGLSSADEGTKKDKLYELINSDGYRQSFQITERILGELQQIDVEEVAAHKKIWEQRGARLRRLDKMIREANESIAAIVESPELACATHSAESQRSDSKPATHVVRANIQI